MPWRSKNGNSPFSSSDIDWTATVRLPTQGRRVLDPIPRSPCRRETVRKTGHGDFAKTLPSSEGDRFIVHLSLPKHRFLSPAVYSNQRTLAHCSRPTDQWGSSGPRHLNASVPRSIPNLVSMDLAFASSVPMPNLSGHSLLPTMPLYAFIKFRYKLCSA